MSRCVIKNTWFCLGKDGKKMSWCLKEEKKTWFCCHTVIWRRSWHLIKKKKPGVITVKMAGKCPNISLKAPSFPGTNMGGKCAGSRIKFVGKWEANWQKQAATVVAAAVWPSYHAATILSSSLGVKGESSWSVIWSVTAKCGHVTKAVKMSVWSEDKSCSNAGWLASGCGWNFTCGIKITSGENWHWKGERGWSLQVMKALEMFILNVK